MLELGLRLGIRLNS